MSKYKAGDKVVLGILSIDGDGYYIVGSEHYSWWASPKNLDEVVEPLSTYTDQLNDKIKRQEAEITQLIAENEELKGLNSAICDVCKNDKFLKEMTEQSRAAGQQEAWELAKKIALVESEGGYSSEELDEIFGRCQYLIEIFNLTYHEAAAKVAEWEHKKEEICVGDVLLSNDIGEKCIVTHINNETVTTLWGDGSYGDRSKNYIREGFKKIGHIDVASMLAQIGGEQEW